MPVFEDDKQDSVRLADMTEFGFDFGQIEAIFESRMLSYEDTLRQLVNPKASIARFGDGELKQLVRGYNIGFQPFSLSLQRDLREVLRNPPPNMLIGFPPVFRNMQWATLWKNLLPELIELFSEIPSLANTAVSRPPCFSELGDTAVTLWRSVWENQEVCVITGKGSRFELHDELFGSARGIRTLWTAPTDAYSALPQILKAIHDAPRADRYLLSLGSAGTVLAHKLAQSGFSALDIGHLSGSYDFAVRNGVYPEKMPLVRDVL